MERAPVRLSQSETANPVPLSGVIRDGAHWFAIRVYYEDTDLSGIVYHANYLRFIERARSDLLRLLGIDQRNAHETGEGSYAVADLSIRYVKPARLDDDLLVKSQCLELKAATVLMRQRISCQQTLLTDATVRVAFLAPDGRPRRQPADWLQRFRPLVAGAGLSDGADTFTFRKD